MIAEALDKIVSLFDPKAGFERVTYRKALEVRAAYDAASSRRRGTSFGTFDPNGEDVSSESATISKRAKDSERNNAWGTQAVRILTTNALGWGADPIVKNKGVKKRWRKWSRGDVTLGEPALNMSGAQHLIAKTMFGGGEVFLIRVVTPKGLRLQIRGGDEIDTSKDLDPQKEGAPRTVNGIEYDAAGERVRYWFKTAEGLPFAVGAQDVHHVFIPKWTKQNRGISEFAAALPRLQNLDRLEDAQLNQQIVAACLGVFIKDLDGSLDPNVAATEEPMRITPGMVGRLAPGKDVSVVNPPASNGQNTLVQNALRGVAAAFGVTYEDLTGDYSSANFSTMRAARLGHWRWIAVLQYVVFERMLNRIFEWWATIENVRIDEAPLWSFPVMPMLDPEVEGVALRRNIRSGAVTPNEAIAELGKDPTTHWDDYGEQFKYIRSLGIVIDSDAGKVTDMGQVQVQEPKKAEKNSS